MAVSALVVVPLLSTMFMMVAIPQATGTEATTVHQTNKTVQLIGTDFRSGQVMALGEGNVLGTVGTTDFSFAEATNRTSDWGWDPATGSMTFGSNADGKSSYSLTVSRFIEERQNVSFAAREDISPDLIETAVTWTADVPGRELSRRQSVLNYLRAPARQPSAGGYVLFATGDIKWSGSDGVALGNVHANGTVTVSGSDHHAVAGSVEGATDVVVSGSDNGFDFVNSRAALLPMPVSYRREDFPCTFTFPGDVTLESVSEVWLDEKKELLKPGVYCSPGRIELSGSHVTGQVTFIGGEVKVSGSETRLFAYRDGLLALAEGPGLEAFHLSGSDPLLRGVVYAPNGRAKISGSDVRLDGSIFAKEVEVTGSESVLVYAASLFPLPSAVVHPPPAP